MKLTTVAEYRSSSRIQRGESKDLTSRIEQRALQLIDNEDSVGLAPAYRQGKNVLFAAGLDAFTLCECETEENAEIIVLLWNYCRDIDGIAKQLAKCLRVKIR